MTNRNAVLELVRRVLVSWKNRGVQPFGALGVLSPPEKALLREYLVQDTRTIRAPTLAGAALGLEHAEIIAIYREPVPAPGAPDFVLGLNAWAWEQLRSHPELVGIEDLRLTRRRSVI